MKTYTYTVVKGDTLFSIARRFNLGVEELKSLNRLNSNNLSVGQVLKVRKDAPPPAPPVPPPTTKPSTPASGAAPAIYTVVPGDSLFSISKRFGVTVDQIKLLNKLTSNNLQVGQVLQIPGGASITPNPSPAPPQQPSSPPVWTPAPAPVVTTGNYLKSRQQYGLKVIPDAGFRRYELSVPISGGRSVVARMRDNLSHSTYMKYPEGIMYAGQSLLELPQSMVESVGLSAQQAAALRYVSTHEGKFDAINSYDRAIFSYGFIQFVGAVQFGGSLNRLLAGMKQNAPAQFAAIFQQNGIDLDRGLVTVLDEQGRRLMGDEAWLYIQKNVPLYGPFIQAGYDEMLVLEQLRAANQFYVQPALNYQLQLQINGIRIYVPRLRDILSSEALLSALIAIAINRGTTGMGDVIAAAVSAVAGTQRLQDVNALRFVDERAVCQHIASNSTDARTRDRALGVLNAGLDFNKSA